MSDTTKRTKRKYNLSPEGRKRLIEAARTKNPNKGFGSRKQNIRQNLERAAEEAANK